MSVFSGLSSPGSLPSAVSSFSRTYGELREGVEDVQWVAGIKKTGFGGTPPFLSLL